MRKFITMVAKFIWGVIKKAIITVAAKRITNVVTNAGNSLCDYIFGKPTANATT